MGNKTSEWFGYKNFYNVIKVVRYKNRIQIREFKSNEDVKKITGPFLANCKQQAEEIALARIGV